MNQISSLKARQSKVEVEGEVTEVTEPREFSKFGNTGRVATATLKDSSGEIKLTLWNADVDRIHQGDKVKITNGYVGEFQGELQLTAGKYGTLEVLNGNEPKEATAKSSKKDSKKSKKDSEYLDEDLEEDLEDL